jgi:hypothetical protein
MLGDDDTACMVISHLQWRVLVVLRAVDRRARALVGIHVREYRRAAHCVVRDLIHDASENAHWLWASSTMLRSALECVSDRLTDVYVAARRAVLAWEQCLREHSMRLRAFVALGFNADIRQVLLAGSALLQSYAVHFDPWELVWPVVMSTGMTHVDWASMCYEPVFDTSAQLCDDYREYLSPLGEEERAFVMHFSTVDDRIVAALDIRLRRIHLSFPADLHRHRGDGCSPGAMLRRAILFRA